MRANASGHRVGGRCLLLVALGLFLPALVGPGSALNPSLVTAAPPSSIWQVCESGFGAGECRIPRGIAANAENGHVFVGDQENRRIQEFSAWGRFIKSWGWDVVASGPGDDTVVPEDEVEICVPSNGDICKSGISGSGVGQFGPLAGPQGIDVDSAGNVYVVDRDNFRVQKFNPDGNFLLMMGAEVNRTKVDASAPEAEQNICPVVPSDICQAGVQGSGGGEFGSWPIVGSYIAIDLNDKVYVGDSGRIQRFDLHGEYQEEIALPGKTVKSLAVDASGRLYAAYEGESDIHELDPTSATPGESIREFPVIDPRAVAVDGAGNVYAFDRSATEILQFGSGGGLEQKFAEDLGEGSTGLSANLCAGSEQPGSIYVTNASIAAAFVRAYGTPPVACEPPPPVPPEIKTQFALSVNSDSALLRAEINPEFLDDVTFYIEYGTKPCAAGGCEARVPPGDFAPLGGGVTNADVITKGILVSNLLPGTTYHYRFVAKSSGGGPEFGVRPDSKENASFDEGLDSTFATSPLPSPSVKSCSNWAVREGASAYLPDCRGFELVSPIDKNGAGIETFLCCGSNRARAALDQSSGVGDGISYSSKQAFADAVGSPYSSQYVSQRDVVAGWSTHAINAPHEGFPGGSEHTAFDVEVKAFSENLLWAWLVHQSEPSLAPCAPIASSVLYRRENGTDSYEALHCEPNQLFLPASGTIELLGTSEDSCRALFRSNSKLTNDAQVGGPYQLYQAGCDSPMRPEGPLHLVSVLPNGDNCKVDSSAGSSLVGMAGAFNHGREKSVWNALSHDARRLYWSCGDTLYLRTDPDLVAEGDEETVKVASPSFTVAPRFYTASLDGSRALLTTLGGAGFRLQAYDAEDKTITILATGLEDAKGERVDLLGASQDATKVYFVSQEELTEEPNSEGDRALEGGMNLYLHREGVGFSFIGTLSGDDLHKEPITPSPVHPLPFRRASRVSPDGLHAAFISTAPLTGFDNIDANSGEAEAEVFVYDATANGGAGKIVCVSCNFTRERPSGRNIAITGDEGSPARLWAAAWIPGWQTQLYQGRPLSEDGRRLFFNSFEALVTRDTNNRQDVYQWEQVDGTGQQGQEECDEKGAELFNEEASGCISLISSGKSPEDSEFIDADKDGSDVFIRTAESLVPKDPGLVDIYDARIGGGFPEPPSTRPPCEGEACQSPPAPPVFNKPSSSSAGPANPPRPKPCPKGKRKVKRNGKTRCVPRHRKAKKGAQAKRRAGAKQGRAAR